MRREVRRTLSSRGLVTSLNEEEVSFEEPPSTEIEALLAEVGLRRLAVKFETEDITPEMLQYLVRGEEGHHWFSMRIVESGDVGEAESNCLKLELFCDLENVSWPLCFTG